VLIIKDYKEVERKLWSEFVAGHPDGNIFHIPEMFDLYISDDKYDPVFVSVVNPEKTICGLLIAYIHREYGGFLGELTSRAIIWGGPLIKGQDPEIAEMLLSEFNNICRKKAVYCQFRNLWDTDKYLNSFNNSGFKYEDHLNFLFDLGKGEKLLWEKMHPTRRKQINRSIKRGITARIVEKLKQDELNSCYTILRLVYKAARLPYPDLTFFQKAFHVLGECGYLKTIIAMFEGKIIGFRFFLSYRGMLYDWYAGSMPEHHDKYPNDLMPWELMKWGVVNGYSTFDFGGAGKPGVPYGVRDYKMKFGGDQVNFGRFEKINKPVFMRLATAGFKVWRLLKIQ
jgi:hypothetical protein